MQKKIEKIDRRSSPVLKQILLNRKQTSQFLGISDKVTGDINPTVIKKEGQKVFYDLKDTVALYVAHREKIANNKSNTKSQEETRLIKIKADRAELEFAQYKNELHDAKVVKSVWADQILRFRSRLLAMPAKLSLRLSVLTEPNKVEASIRKEVLEVLEEFQKYKISDYSVNEDAETVEDDEPKRGRPPKKKTAKKKTVKKKTVKKKTAKKKPAKKK